MDGNLHLLLSSLPSSFSFFILVCLIDVHRLGITLGSRLWYDFSDDKEWDKKIAELVKGIYPPPHPSPPFFFSSLFLLSFSFPTYSFIHCFLKAIGNHGKGNIVRQVGTSPPPPVPAAPARKPVAEWSLDGTHSPLFFFSFSFFH